MKMEAFVPIYRIARSLLIFFLLSSLLGSCDHKGTMLTIENKGQAPLDSVTVHVTGNQYFLGRILPGEARKKEIKVTGESHVELSHSKNRRFVLDVYLEPGYKGAIDAKVTPDSVLSVVQNTKVGP